jgi:hypothetical protein
LWALYSTINVIGKVWSDENASDGHSNDNGQADVGKPEHAEGF